MMHHQYTHMHDMSSPSLSLSNHALEMRSMSIDRPGTGTRDSHVLPSPSLYAGGRDGAGTPTTMATNARLGISSSPIAWTKQKVAGGHKGDADSLRTDFLQV